MILEIIVRPKAFYTSSTDLTVRSWVYEFEDATNVFRHHQHSVGAIALEGDTLWTACGDSIARAFDAKSGALKRSFVGHEAAVNCMMITEGKLFTGSSDGTLRVWNAKDVSEELLVDDGPPPPAPVVVDADIEENAGETPAEEVTPEEETPADVEASPEEDAAPPEDEVQDIEGDGDEPPAEETPKEVEDEMADMEQELAAQG